MSRIPEWALRAMNILSFAMIVSVVFFYGLGNLDRSDPYDIDGIEGAIVSPGDVLSVTMSVKADVTRNCSRSTSRWLVDAADKIYLLPYDSAAKPTDASERRRHYTTTRVYDVPQSIALGNAAYVSRSQYICNPAQQWWPIEVTEVVRFTIR